MITGLDHVVILVRDIAAGEVAYKTLFARTPAWRNSGDGADRVLFTLDNMTLELMSPSAECANAARIRNVMAEHGEGLASICFRTNDIAKMHRRLDRLRLKPEPTHSPMMLHAVTRCVWMQCATTSRTVQAWQSDSACGAAPSGQ